MLISRWARAFGDDALKIGIFENFCNRGLFKSYCDWLELPSEVRPQLERFVKDARTIERESLPAVCIEFLRLCNQVPIPLERHQRIVRALYNLAPILIERYGSACKYILSPEERARIIDYFAASNEAIRAQFFPNSATLFPSLSKNEPNPPSLNISELIPLLLQEGILAP